MTSPSLAPDDLVVSGSSSAPPTAAGNGQRSALRLLPLLGLGLALVLWCVGLAATRTDDLGNWGLLAAFGWAWYAALGVNLALVVWSLVGSTVPANPVLAALLGLLLLMLYGSAAIIEPGPRLPWVYKHIAVTRYLEVHGAVDPSIDIYQRWPGFFALTAQAAALLGLPDPVDWAWVAEPGFAIVDALLVFAIARTLSRDRRWCWTAVTFFVVANWIGQNYFAPQALGFCLYLVVCLLQLTFLRGQGGRLGTLLERLAARVTFARRGGLTPVSAAAVAPSVDPGRAHRAWAVLVILVAFGVVVASHQLTPYLALLGLIPLYLVRYLRPLPVAAALVVLTLGYLVPNMSYLAQHFGGVLSGFDVVDNAVYTAVDRSTLTTAAVTQAWTSRLISVAMFLLAVAGLVRRIRAGSARSALMVGWLMVAPALILVGQSYGGEGRLRIYLFALPWCAIAAAWLFWPVEPTAPRRVRAGLAAAVVVLTGLFAVTYFQPEADYRIPPAEVAAAEWSDQTAQEGDVVLPTSLPFPVLIGPNYDKVMPATTLADSKQYFVKPMTQADVLAVAASYSPPGAAGYRVFVVFSDSQLRYSDRHGLFAPGELAGLEAQIASDPRSALVYRNSATRTYRIQ